jgi:hypothetical protein
MGLARKALFKNILKMHCEMVLKGLVSGCDHTTTIGNVVGHL